MVLCILGESANVPGLTQEVLTRALVPIAGIPRQAGAAEGAVSMVDASCLVSRCTGMSAILTGVGRRGNH